MVARPYLQVEPRFFAALFRTGDHMSEISNRSRGIVKDRNRLYCGEFKQILSPCPPSTEQAAIIWSGRSGRSGRCILRRPAFSSHLVSPTTLRQRDGCELSSYGDSEQGGKYSIGYLVLDPRRGIPVCGVITWPLLSEAFKAGVETHCTLENAHLSDRARIVDVVRCCMDVETSMIVQIASSAF